MQIQCPHCNEICDTDAELEKGQRLQCPYCAQHFTYTEELKACSDNSRNCVYDGNNEECVSKTNTPPSYGKNTVNVDDVRLTLPKKALPDISKVAYPHHRVNTSFVMETFLFPLWWIMNFIIIISFATIIIINSQLFHTKKTYSTEEFVNGGRVIYTFSDSASNSQSSLSTLGYTVTTLGFILALILNRLVYEVAKAIFETVQRLRDLEDINSKVHDIKLLVRKIQSS